MSNNQSIIRIVVLAIAIMAGICVCGLTWCLVNGKELTQNMGMAYVGIANALIGYLAGCLSKTTPTPTTPTETKIINTEKEPVNTTEVK